MSNKNFRKYTATTMAAAAAATTIVPVVASADTTEFPDVSDNNVHRDNIMKLVERNVIEGYENGNFGPYDSITRGQVASMLTKALDLPIPEDIDSVLEKYSDVKSGDGYAEEIAAVTAAKVFEGSEDGTFGRYDNISRQQMATVLVEAFDLKDYDNGEKVEVNFDNISDAHADNVQIIANLGITSEADNYGGYDDVLRGQFSSFLIDTLELTEEIVVKNVNALTDKIQTAEEQQLEIQVNGNRTVTVEELVEAGYDVEFLYSSADSIFTTDEAVNKGIIDASELKDEFRYAVKITAEDGTEFTSEQQTVTAYDVEEVVEVTKVALFDETNEWGQTYVTSNNTGNEFKAVEGVNAFGDTLPTEEQEAKYPEIESVTSSDITVAYYDEVNGLQVVGEGSVTFTVAFDNDTEITYSTEVVADEKVDSIKEDGETKRFTTTSANSTEVTVLDQYGEPFAGNGEEVTVNLLDENGEGVTELGPFAIDKDGKVNVSLPTEEELLEEGTYTLEVVYGSGDDEVKLGSTKIELVELDSSSVDEFKLSTEKDTIDLYDNEESDFTVAVGATYDGIELSDDEIKNALTELAGSLQVSSSNDEVATVAKDFDENSNLEITATPKSEGTTTVSLEQVEGDFVTVLASIELTVENSTPQITDLTLAEGVEKLEVEQDGDEWKLSNTENLVSTNVESIDEEMIDSIVFSEQDGKAIVTIVDKYGGETFVLDAVDVSNDNN